MRAIRFIEVHKVGILTKIKDRLNEKLEEKKEEAEWKRQLEAEAKEEAKEDLKAVYKENFIKKEKERLTKKPLLQRIGEEFKEGGKFGEKMGRMLGKDDIFSQDKIAGLMDGKPPKKKK